MQLKFSLKSCPTLSFFILLGLVASISSYIILERINTERSFSLIKHESSERVLTIQRAFALSQLAIEASQSFFSSIDDIDYSKFKRFSSPLIAKSPGIHAIEWIPRIKQSDVNKYLSKIQGESFSDFRLTEKSANGALIDVLSRQEYYPVYYIEPYVSNEKAHGFDLASNPARLDALSKARDTGESIATERINLVQVKQDNYGFLIFSPVYSTIMSDNSSISDRQNSIKGFALGVFEFNEIINGAVKIFEGNEFYYQLLDISDLKDKQLLFNNIPEDTIESDINAQTLNFSEIKYASYNKDIEFLGRIWRITCVPSALYKNKYKTYFPLLVMFLGILLTCIFSYVFYKRMHEEHRIKQLVEQQTSKLLQIGERLEFAIEGAQLGLWEWNITTGELYWSDRIAPLFGYTDVYLETSYDNFVAAIHADDRASVLSAINSCIEEGETYNIEHRVVWPDGQIKWVQETGNVVRDKKGIALKMIGVVEDIHHRKLTEESLRESEEKYRRLFELSEDPMWLIVGDNFMLANKAAAQILGYKSTGELINISPSLLSPEYQDDGQLSFIKANEMMIKAYRNGYHRFEWLHTKKNGQNFPVEVTLTRIPYEGAEALFCVWRDITEAKLQQAQLTTAKEEAEKANQAKSDFLSSMSHELRTPMNAVLGFSELLATDIQAPLTEDQLESVEQIIESGKHLLSLIDDVLDLSKIESGNNEVSIETIDTNTLVSQVLLLIQPQAEQNGITLENKVSNNSSFKIRADQKKLKQVLLNLCSNAIKYNSENGMLTISCNEVSENKIRFNVSDTGKGVPEELFPNLFEPFDRLDKASSNIQGTGIGLTICKQLVEQMGGAISVFTNPDKGLTFWVEFDKGSGN